LAILKTALSKLRDVQIRLGNAAVGKVAVGKPNLDALQGFLPAGAILIVCAGVTPKDVQAALADPHAYVRAGEETNTFLLQPAAINGGAAARNETRAEASSDENARRRLGLRQAASEQRAVRFLRFYGNWLRNHMIADLDRAEALLAVHGETFIDELIHQDEGSLREAAGFLAIKFPAMALRFHQALSQGERPAFYEELSKVMIRETTDQELAQKLSANLGRFYLEQNNPEQALSYLLRALLICQQGSIAYKGELDGSIFRAWQPLARQSEQEQDAALGSFLTAERQRQEAAAQNLEREWQVLLERPQAELKEAVQVFVAQLPSSDFDPFLSAKVKEPSLASQTWRLFNILMTVEELHPGTGLPLAKKIVGRLADKLTTGFDLCEAEQRTLIAGAFYFCSGENALSESQIRGLNNKAKAVSVSEEKAAVDIIQKLRKDKIRANGLLAAAFLVFGQRTVQVPLSEAIAQTEVFFGLGKSFKEADLATIGDMVEERSMQPKLTVLETAFGISPELRSVFLQEIIVLARKLTNRKDFTDSAMRVVAWLPDRAPGWASRDEYYYRGLYAVAMTSFVLSRGEFSDQCIERILGFTRNILEQIPADLMISVERYLSRQKADIRVEMLNLQGALSLIKATNMLKAGVETAAAQPVLEAAEVALRRSIVLFPTNNAKVDLAEVLTHLGKEEEAQQVLVDLSRTDYRGYLRRAEYLIDQSNEAAAGPILGQLYEEMESDFSETGQDKFEGGVLIYPVLSSLLDLSKTTPMLSETTKRLITLMATRYGERMKTGIMTLLTHQTTSKVTVEMKDFLCRLLEIDRSLFV